MIHVLWFDDVVFSAVVDDAKMQGIIIDQVDNLRDGIRKLRENKTGYDLLLIDANYRLDAEAIPKMMLADTIKECERVTQGNVPWLVLSKGMGYAGAETLDFVVPGEDWMAALGLKRWYSKEEYVLLLQDIPRVVDYFNSPRRALKLEHKEVFELFHDDKSLLPISYQNDLLDILEAYNKPYGPSDQSMLNKIRQFASGPLLKGLHQLGVVPEELTSLNEMERHFVRAEWRKHGLSVWAQTAMTHLVKVCQDASHDEMEAVGGVPLGVSASYKDGSGKYILRGVINALLNVLMWMSTYVGQYPDKMMNQKHFPLSDKQRALYDRIKSYEGQVFVVMQSESGDCYAEECLLPKGVDGLLGTKVKLSHVRRNKTGHGPYPFLADCEQADIEQTEININD